MNYFHNIIDVKQINYCYSINERLWTDRGVIKDIITWPIGQSATSAAMLAAECQ